MNALFGYVLSTPIAGQNRQLTGSELLTFILVWILCALISVMIHELGHVITGRIFGQPGNITVTGLGGQAVGEYGELRPWQRILVVFMGPGAGFAFVALMVCFDPKYWNMIVMWLEWPDWLKVNLFWIDNIDPLLRMGGSPTYDLAWPILFFINLFVNIMNLLPIIPMDGGMIFKEVCCLISPSGGPKFAFISSFVLALGVTGYMLIVVLMKHEIITQPLPVYYPFVFPEITLIMFAMMAYQCLQSYRQLASTERHEMYKNDD